MTTKEYLGDGVYAEFGGFEFVLTTRSDLSGHPTNTIVLEPSVFAALKQYVYRQTPSLNTEERLLPDQ